MRTIYWIVISLVLGGCATEEHGRLINQEEVTWIEKGVTIRSQVVERFGSPRFEVGGKSQSTTTTVHVDEPPKRTKATYLYTRSDSRIPFYAKAHTRQFWVIYDEKGVVQDYGFIGDVPASP